MRQRPTRRLSVRKAGPIQELRRRQCRQPDLVPSVKSCLSDQLDEQDVLVERGSGSVDERAQRTFAQAKGEFDPNVVANKLENPIGIAVEPARVLHDFGW